MQELYLCFAAISSSSAASANTLSEFCSNIFIICCKHFVCVLQQHLHHLSQELCLCFAVTSSSFAATTLSVFCSNIFIICCKYFVCVLQQYLHHLLLMKELSVFCSNILIICCQCKNFICVLQQHLYLADVQFSLHHPLELCLCFAATSLSGRRTIPSLLSAASVST